MATWQDLEHELAIWGSNRQIATFWWRDDDAGSLTPELEQLLSISNDNKAPIHLAAIPTRLEKPTIDAINASAHIRVLQHGYSHTDYAPKGQGSWELGDHRPIDIVLKELSQGYDSLQKAFGSKFIPIQVPPWTRISMNVARHLTSIGYKGLSLEGPQHESEFCQSINVMNPHCDPIKWKQNARFKGVEHVLSCLISHLEMRRANNNGNRTEATGICTHHLDHTQDLWAFLEQFAQFINNHPHAKWIDLNSKDNDQK